MACFFDISHIRNLCNSFKSMVLGSCAICTSLFKFNTSILLRC